MKMKLILLFISMLACTCTQARREKNCGLTCYRWGKCMGQLDGTNRPGQLGDTGIIVLNTCSPIEKGCDCLTFLEAEKTTTTTTTTTTTAAAPASAYGSSRSGLSRVRNHLRVPRKQDQDLYKEIEEKAPIVQNREVSSLNPTRQTYRQRTGIRSSFGRSSSSGNSPTSSGSSSTSSESSPVSSVSYSTSSSSRSSSSYSTRISNGKRDESSTPSIPATSARISAARRNLFNSERRRSLRFKH